MFVHVEHVTIITLCKRTKEQKDRRCALMGALTERGNSRFFRSVLLGGVQSVRKLVNCKLYHGIGRMYTLDCSRINIMFYASRVVCCNLVSSHEFSSRAISVNFLGRKLSVDTRTLFTFFFHLPFIVMMRNNESQ